MAENQNGGFWGGKKSFDSSIKKTKSSEAKLITEYKKMDNAVIKYQTAYENHLSNLKTLDDYANFKGMEELFQKVIMKEHLKKNGDVDKKTPILLRNYFIEKGITPSEFRKEHIMQQIEYILENQFPGKDQMFIKNKEIELGKYEFILYITTIENIKKSRKISHKDYVVDFSEARAALKDIIGTTKKNLKRVSSILEMSERKSSRKHSRSKSSRKSHGSDTSKLKSSSRKKSRKTGSGGKDDKHDKHDNGAAALMIDLLGDNSMGKSSRRTSSRKSKTKISLDLFKTPSEIKKGKEATKATGAVAGPVALQPGAPGMGPVPVDLTMRKEQLAAAPPGGVAPAGDKAAMCAAIPNPSIGSCKAAGCAWYDDVGNKCLPERPPRPPRPGFQPGYQPQGFQQGAPQATQPDASPRPNMDFGSPMQAPAPKQDGLGF